MLCYLQHPHTTFQIERESKSDHNPSERGGHKRHKSHSSSPIVRAHSASSEEAEESASYYSSSRKISPRSVAPAESSHSPHKSYRSHSPKKSRRYMCSEFVFYSQIYWNLFSVFTTFFFYKIFLWFIFCYTNVAVYLGLKSSG